MDRYRVWIGEEVFTIDIDKDEIWVNGQRVCAGIHFLNDDGLFMLEQESGKREFLIKPQENGSFQVSTRGLQVEAIVESEREHKRRSMDKEDTGLIRAPIPGVVMNILVKNGDAIVQNQVLVTLESMKMLMDFRAPFDGVVVRVPVVEGQNVEKGDELVIITKS